MLKWIEKRADGRTVIVLFVLAMSVYALMMLVTIPVVRDGSGGVEIFDLRPFGYSEQDARLIVSSLSDTARVYYRRVQIPVDFVYPLLLGLFGMFALAWARRQVAIPRWSIVVPLGVTLFDYLENISILLLLRNHTGSVVAWFASISTVAKSLLTTISMTGILVILLLVGIKALVGLRGGAHEA